MVLYQIQFKCLKITTLGTRLIEDYFHIYICIIEVYSAHSVNPTPEIRIFSLGFWHEDCIVLYRIIKPYGIEKTIPSLQSLPMYLQSFVFVAMFMFISNVRQASFSILINCYFLKEIMQFNMYIV